MLKFYVDIFRTSLFLNTVRYLVHTWYDDRYLSKIWSSTIPVPVHDLKVNVTEWLSLTFKVFRTTLFLNHVLYLDHVCNDDRSSPKLHAVPCRPHTWPWGQKGQDPQLEVLRIFVLKFSVFVKPLMDLIHVWHGDRVLWYHLQPSTWL